MQDEQACNLSKRILIFIANFERSQLPEEGKSTDGKGSFGSNSLCKQSTKSYFTTLFNDYVHIKGFNQ